MTAFTPDDLRQIADLADHINYSAPGITPKGSEGRLPLQVRVLDAMNEAAVIIEVPAEGDVVITFPNATPTTEKSPA